MSQAISNRPAMMELVIIGGKYSGSRFPVQERTLLIGRANDSDIALDGSNVSRRHAQVLREGPHFFVKDLGSRNGTYLNDQRVTGKALLASNDILRIGGHSLRVESTVPEGDLTIQRQTLALPTNPDLFQENASQKLKAVLQFAHQLSNSLSPDLLFGRVLDQLLILFPQADRALILADASPAPILRAFKTRKPDGSAEPLFSRSIARQVFQKRIAVLAEDTRTFEANLSIQSSGIRSLICVPLQTHSAILGAIQVDRRQLGSPFTAEDLHMLTAVAMQVANVLENALLHHELLENERMQRELMMAREIQQAFLPRDLPVAQSSEIDVYGELKPALEVAGDFYDCVALEERRLAIAVADVSGKGVGAALFMAMVRALWRQFLQHSRSPAEIVMRLNDALANDNPKFLFVTFLAGIYDPSNGECALVRAGHPAPLLRRRGGKVEQISADPGVLLGIESTCRGLEETRLKLHPGDALLFYTDGVIEAVGPDSAEMFGETRLSQEFGSAPETDPLPEYARRIRQAIQRFSAGTGPQDDLTLLFLRRKGP